MAGPDPATRNAHWQPWMVRNSSDGVVSRTGRRLGGPALILPTTRYRAFRLAPKICREWAFASACCCRTLPSRSETGVEPSFFESEDVATGSDFGARGDG